MSHLVVSSVSSHHHSIIPVKQVEMFGQTPTTCQSSSVGPVSTPTSNVLTPTSPYTGYQYNSNNNSIYQLSSQDLVTTLDMKTFTSPYSDFTDPFPSCAETPSSVFSEACTPSGYSHSNNIGFREDVFRFEPEDIERLTKTSHYTDSSQAPPTTTASLNFDIEYFNYDEINCQSKNQSPCSSPQLMDPWMTLNLRDTYNTAPATSPKISNNSSQSASFTYSFGSQQTSQPQLSFQAQQYPASARSPDCGSIRPKDKSSADMAMEDDTGVHRDGKFILQSYNKLPSMNGIGSFGTTAQYSPRNSSCSLHVETIAYDELTSPHQYHQHQDYSPKSDECNDSYEHLPENYNSSDLMMHEKPNREHKDIWTIEEIKGELDEVVITSFSSSSATVLDGDNNNCDDDNTCNGVASTVTVATALTAAATDDDDDATNDGGPGTVGDIDDDDDSVFMEIQETPHISSVPSSRTTIAEDDGQSSPLPVAVNQLECQWTDCNEVFPNQEEFVAHIEKRHVDVKKGEDFSCFWVDCPRRYKPFNARYKLLIHMRVHSGEKPNKCPFSGCNKAFSRLENLKIHQRSHTGERPYGCQYKGCLKAFSNSSDRAKHQRTHYDTKPYACQIAGCTKRYTDPSSLRKHVKNHSLRNGNINGRRKSSSASINNSMTTATARLQSKIRRHSESSVPVGPLKVLTTTSAAKTMTTQNPNSTTTASMISSNIQYNKLASNQQQSENCENHFRHQNDHHEQPIHAMHFFDSDYLFFDDAFTVGKGCKLSSSTETVSAESKSKTATDVTAYNGVHTDDYTGAISGHYTIGDIKSHTPYSHQEKHQEQCNHYNSGVPPAVQISFPASPSRTTTTTILSHPASEAAAGNNNSMNFNELSNCIVTIESNQNENSIDACHMESTYVSMYHQDTNDASPSSDANYARGQASPSTDEHATTTNDGITDIDSNEFVSFEYVKKLLSDTFDYANSSGQQNGPGVDSDDASANADVDLENNFDIEYLNNFI